MLYNYPFILYKYIIMNIDNFLDTIEKQRSIHTSIEKYFFEDRFLDMFKKKYLVLDDDQISIVYNYKCKQKGGSNIKQLLSNLIEYHKNYLKTSGQVANIFMPFQKTLYKNFFEDLKKKYTLSFDKPTYIYKSTIVEQYEQFIPTKQIYINKKITESPSTVIIDLPIETVNKFKDEYIYTTFDAVNKIKMGDDLILSINFAPWIEQLFNWYLVLINSFKSYYIVFPCHLGKKRNIVFFILKNKVKNIKIPNKKSFCINVDIKDKKIVQKRFIMFAEKVLKYINKTLILIINLNILFRKNKIMYKLVRNKVLSKVYNF